MRELLLPWRRLRHLISRHEMWALGVALRVRVFGVVSILTLMVWVIAPVLLIWLAGNGLAQMLERDLQRYTWAGMLLASTPTWFWYMPWLVLLRSLLLGDRRGAETKRIELEERLSAPAG